jgi:hypothetical protein
MVTFLFWNVGRKPLQSTIAHLVENHHVDILMLAESQIDESEILVMLNHMHPPEFFYSPKRIYDKVEVFTRFHSDFLSIVRESDLATIRSLSIPGKSEILLAITHFPSKLHLSTDGQAMRCVDLARDIASAEEFVQHHRTVLVGDLNMNPFENGVVAASGLRGTMSREIATHQNPGKHNHYFYNPMWNFLGDAQSGYPGVSGTYYYKNSSDPVNLFWYTFDQVLVRPDLLESFDTNFLRILVSDGMQSLLNRNGLPGGKNGSDHLPLLFRLDV